MLDEIEKLMAHGHGETELLFHRTTRTRRYKPNDPTNAASIMQEIGTLNASRVRIVSTKVGEITYYEATIRV